VGEKIEMSISREFVEDFFNRMLNDYHHIKIILQKYIDIEIKMITGQLHVDICTNKFKKLSTKLDGLLNDHTLTEYKKAKIVPTRLQYEDHYKSSSSTKSIKKKASECLLKRPYGQTRNVERKLIEKCQCSEHKDSGSDKVGRPYATIQRAGQSKDASTNNSKLPKPDINWDKFKDRSIALPPGLSEPEIYVYGYQKAEKELIVKIIKKLKQLPKKNNMNSIEELIAFWEEKLNLS